MSVKRFRIRTMEGNTFMVYAKNADEAKNKVFMRGSMIVSCEFYPLNNK